MEAARKQVADAVARNRTARDDFAGDTQKPTRSGSGKPGFGNSPRVVDPDHDWVVDVERRLKPDELRNFRLLTKDKTPAQIKQLFGGEVHVAIAKAQGSKLPNDLITLRRSLDGDARHAFDAKWGDMTRGEANPDANRINSFRKFLEDMRTKGGGSRQGLAGARGARC